MIGGGIRALMVGCVPLALAACAQANDADANLDSLDAELADGNSTANMRDPAMMAALQDQIMVDPALAAKANYDAIRPPAQPYSTQVPPDMVAGAARPGADMSSSETLKSAPLPVGGQGCTQCAAAREALTLGGLVERQSNRAARNCAGSISYSTRWALRLPADLPLYPDANVVEAAGNAENGCATRIVSFTSRAPVRTVIDWYYTRATNAGYSADHQADGEGHVVAGTRGEAAYAVFVRKAGAGTQVELVVNNGR